VALAAHGLEAASVTVLNAVKPQLQGAAAAAQAEEAQSLQLRNEDQLEPTSMHSVLQLPWLAVGSLP